MMIYRKTKTAHNMFAGKTKLCKDYKAKITQQT